MGPFCLVKSCNHSMKLKFLILIILIRQFISFCEGDWHYNVSQSQLIPIQSSRVSYLHSNSTSIWLATACPTQSIQHTCYYHNARYKSQSAEFRLFISTDPQCKPFQPLDFLNSFRNTDIVLFGDSTLMQVWQSLVCTMYQITETFVYVDWNIRKNYPPVQCPFGAKYCHNLGGVIKFMEYNSSIIFRRWLTNNEKALLSSDENLHVTKSQILIINFGIHYNDMELYRADLKEFIEDMEKVKDTLPRIFFIESLPQHFNTSNGYYYEGFNETQCYPIHNPLINAPNGLDTNTQIPLKHYVLKEDWRNIVLHDLLTNHSYIQIIPIARNLYSQWDVHIGSTRFYFFHFADCTHWCFPSGVFTYVHQMVDNYLIKYNSTTSSYPLNDPSHPPPPSPNNKPILINTNLEYNREMIQITWDIPDFTLIRPINAPNVYLMFEHMKHLFTGIRQFILFGYDFDDVKVISVEESNTIPTGENIISD